MKTYGFQTNGEAILFTVRSIVPGKRTDTIATAKHTRYVITRKFIIDVETFLHKSILQLRSLEDIDGVVILIPKYFHLVLTRCHEIINHPILPSLYSLFGRIHIAPNYKNEICVFAENNCPDDLPELTDKLLYTKKIELEEIK